MRKKLLTLAMLLTSVGAWAQDVFVEPEVGRFYIIKGQSATVPYLGNQNVNATTNNIATVAEQGSAGVFTLTDAGEGKYYVECVNALTAKKYIKHSGDIGLAETPQEHKVTLEVANAETKTYYFSVNGQNYLHNNKAAGNGIGTGAKTATNFNQWGFIETENPGEPVSLTYTLEDENGSQYSGSYTGYPGVSKPSFAGVTYSNVTWDGNSMSADISFPFPISKDGGSTNPTFISSYSGDGFKWYASGDAVCVTKNLAVTVANVDKFLWAVYPEFNEGAFTFNVKNIATGKYISSTSASNSHNKGTVTLAETPSALTLEAENQLKLATGKYLSLNSSGQTAEQNLGTYDSHPGTKNKFPAPTFNVTITDGYATIYSPCAFTLPEGLTAYAVTDASNGVAYLTEKQDVPANEGALLKGEDGQYALTVVGAATSDWETNLLVGSLDAAQEYAMFPIYILAKPEGKEVGFYKAALTDGLFTNKPNKAYFSIFGSNARFLFNFGTETGIECIDEVEAEAAGGAVYDIAGRRVKGAQKGLYIVGGKVVIK